MIRTHKELIRLKTFRERFEYLSLAGKVGQSTFGFDRYLNQALYRSPEWKALRHEIIIRDNGCDLADEDREIQGKILIHHMNPITEKDIVDRSDFLFNPDYLITTQHATHNAIHYGDANLLPKVYVERTPNDTIPWR